MARELYLSITPTSFDPIGEFDTETDFLKFMLEEGGEIDPESIRKMPISALIPELKAQIASYRKNTALKEGFLRNYAIRNNDEAAIKKREEMQSRKAFWDKAFAEKAAAEKASESQNKTSTRSLAPAEEKTPEKQDLTNEERDPVNETELSVSEAPEGEALPEASPELKPAPEDLTAKEAIEIATDDIGELAGELGLDTEKKEEEEELSFKDYLLQEYTEEGQSVNQIIKRHQKPDLYKALSPEYRSTHPIDSVNKREIFKQIAAENGIEIPPEAN